MIYLLDTNVFIQAKNLHYGFDFCPAFWDWIDRSHQAGTVFSVERVRIELVGGEDDLVHWAQQRTGLFIQPDENVLPSLQMVSGWASQADYEPMARTIFLAAADYFLIAHAHAYGYTVVTHEVVSASRKKIKIPNACIELGVKWVTPFEMLRAERARFVLADPSHVS